MDKFLSRIDNLLDIILKAYRLPLFIVGTEKYRGVLKNSTNTSEQLLIIYKGMMREVTLPELKELAEPRITD